MSQVPLYDRHTFSDTVATCVLQKWKVLWPLLRSFFGLRHCEAVEWNHSSSMKNGFCSIVACEFRLRFRLLFGLSHRHLICYVFRTRMLISAKADLLICLLNVTSHCFSLLIWLSRWASEVSFEGNVLVFFFLCI
uniref:Secreted protein n=1 Tax=Parascaris univalens TaxID=6257 RepID=A0A914ZI85_PARUN